MWFGLTEAERADVYESKLRRKKGSGRSRQLTRNNRPATDYNALLSKWESEASPPSEPPKIRAGYNVNGVVPISPATVANKLMDHYAYLTFKVARDFAERFGLTDEEHFRLWGIARKELHKLLTDTPATPPDFLEIDLICRMLWKWRTVPMDTPARLAKRMSDDPIEREIIRLHGEGMSARRIAKRVGKGKNKVNRILRSVADRYKYN